MLFLSCRSRSPTALYTASVLSSIHSHIHAVVTATTLSVGEGGGAPAHQERRTFIIVYTVKTQCQQPCRCLECFNADYCGETRKTSSLNQQTVLALGRYVHIVYISHTKDAFWHVSLRRLFVQTLASGLSTHEMWFCYSTVTNSEIWPVIVPWYLTAINPTWFIHFLTAICWPKNEFIFEAISIVAMSLVTKHAPLPKHVLVLRPKNVYRRSFKSSDFILVEPQTCLHWISFEFLCFFPQSSPPPQNTDFLGYPTVSRLIEKTVFASITLKKNCLLQP